MGLQQIIMAWKSLTNVWTFMSSKGEGRKIATQLYHDFSRSGSKMPLRKPLMIMQFGKETENHSGSDNGVCITASDANKLNQWKQLSVLLLTALHSLVVWQHKKPYWIRIWTFIQYYVHYISKCIIFKHILNQNGNCHSFVWMLYASVHFQVRHTWPGW